ncbi:hypothetical protein FHR51_000888 [Xanthomonas arboricola]|nr:hypothetical protein [Xanthomonas cannabis]
MALGCPHPPCGHLPPQAGEGRSRRRRRVRESGGDGNLGLGCPHPPCGYLPPQAGEGRSRRRGRVRESGGDANRGGGKAGNEVWRERRCVWWPRRRLEAGARKKLRRSGVFSIQGRSRRSEAVAERACLWQAARWARRVAVACLRAPGRRRGPRPRRSPSGKATSTEKRVVIVGVSRPIRQLLGGVGKKDREAGALPVCSTSMRLRAAAGPLTPG